VLGLAEFDDCFPRNICDADALPTARTCTARSLHLARYDHWLEKERAMHRRLPNVELDRMQRARPRER